MNFNRLSVALLLCLCWLNNFAQDGLVEIKAHGSNPGNLKMFLHVPVSLNDNIKRKPLVVVLHGCSQDAATVAVQSGWNKLADHAGFYVLYPQQRFINNTSDCFNWFRKSDIEKDKGEVLSIRQMIDAAIQLHAIDSSKIFVYGLSAGAAMSAALLADYPGLFNAGAIVAGGPFMAATNAINGLATMLSPADKSPDELAAPVMQQNPDYKGRYPKVIIIHGKNDNVVNIKNARQLVLQWTAVHLTDAIADETISSFQNNADIKKYMYRDNNKNDVVIFYEADNLGHALMIDPGNETDKGGETGKYAVDKNFHSTYWIAVDFGLINRPK